MAKHKCENRFYEEGARGGCFFEISESREGVAQLDVGWSCVVVHQREIPISWLAEIIAIATAHKGGIAGFLQENNYAGGYALHIDPAPSQAISRAT